MAFQPEINEKLEVGGITYCIAEHPYAPGMPYGQEGRQAVVYKFFGPDQEEVGLKVFKSRFRVPGMVALSAQLEKFADIPGLSVCRRIVLSARQHSEVLNRFPDLTYSVLMPWLAGPTWMEVMLGETALTPEESLKYARALTEMLTNMEEQNIAHCDLSGPNLIITGMRDPNTAVPVALVDVEQMYGPGIQRPGALPGGSPGYAHVTATDGLWSPEADRFAGAVLIAEMLGWSDNRICKSSWGESFFDPDEMQQDGERYRVLIQVLREKWGEAIAGLFKRAWESELLLHAPTFGEWLVAITNAATAINQNNIQEIEPSVLAEKLTGQSEVTSPSGATEYPLPKYEPCSQNVDSFQTIYPEVAAAADPVSPSDSKNEPNFRDMSPSQTNASPTPPISYSTHSSKLKLVHPVQWVFLTIIVAIVMLLGWVNTSQSGEMKVKDLTLSLKTKDQEIRKVNQKIKNIVLKMDESQLLKINDIKLRNENRNGKALSGFTNRFRQQDIRYISYYIQAENIAAGVKSVGGKLYTKYIYPDGTVNRNPNTCPAGFTTVEDFKFSGNVHELTCGWGNSKGGIYEEGIHRIEFWYKGRLLGKTTFTVY